MTGIGGRQGSDGAGSAPSPGRPVPGAGARPGRSRSIRVGSAIGLVVLSALALAMRVGSGATARNPLHVAAPASTADAQADDSRRVFLPHIGGARGAKPAPGPCAAAIEITHVPEFGALDGILGGRVPCAPAGLSFQELRVAVAIRVEGGWYNKPTWAEPLTLLNAAGEWRCDVTTGGLDHQATVFAALLLPVGIVPPRLAGQAALPPELLEAALASAMMEREAAVRRVLFAGRSWQVKASEVPVDPGPTRYSDRPEDVYVDREGHLHLRVAFHQGHWYASEVLLEESLGLGDYVFRVRGPVHDLPPSVVLGLFVYDMAPDHAHREIDVELSSWGRRPNPTGNAQFVVQPWDGPGRMRRFALSPATERTTHAFRWGLDSVYFESAEGGADFPATPRDVLASWTFRGPDVPPPGAEVARMNLWLFQGEPPAGGGTVEVVVEDFLYRPSD